MVTKSRGLTIGELAAAASVNLETVRYYERIGLMPKPFRSPAGYRLYEPDHVVRLAFVRRARELGFTIEDIRALLALHKPGKNKCADVALIAAAHLADIERKVADLQKLATILSTTLKKCRGGPAPSCPVLDMLELPMVRA